MVVVLSGVAALAGAGAWPQVAAPASAPPSTPPPTDYCSQVAKSISSRWESVRTNKMNIQDVLPPNLAGGLSQEKRKQVNFFVWVMQNQINNFVNAPSCFMQANESNAEASQVIAPARVAFWNAVESFSGSQQQGSSLPSSGATSAVTKPSGPTALAEEFGGANVTQGTSSLTAQWSPGSMLANLASTGAVPLCASGLPIKNCLSPSLLNNVSPLTFKITANTSSGTPSTSGTAVSASSTSNSQAVTVNSSGTKGPSFAGLTVQYAFNSKTTVAGKQLTNQSSGHSGQQAGASVSGGSAPIGQQYINQVTSELKIGNQTIVDLQACEAYQQWASSAIENPLLGKSVPGRFAPDLVSAFGLSGAGDVSIDQGKLADAIGKLYKNLLTEMMASPTCQAALHDFRMLFAAILEARTYEDLTAQQNNKMPVFSLEYDLNTPQNKPSYSTAKGTLTISLFGKKAIQPPTPNATRKLCAEIQTRQSIVTAAPAAEPGKTSAQEAPNEENSCGAGGAETQTGQGALGAEATATQPALSARQQSIRNYAEGQAAAITSASGGNSRSSQRAATTVASTVVKPLTITLTASGDFYNAAPPTSIPSATHVRDFQAGGEIAYKFVPSTTSNAVLTLLGGVTVAGAYSYQDQTSPSILTGPALTDFTDLPSSTTTAYVKRGVIHLAQARFGFGSGTSLSYPLSFTYSNRTELVTHPTWGVQFGVSYNLNSLFASTSGKQGSQ
jgi:hypothetical protein